MFECLPDLPQCWRTYLRNNLLRSDRFGHYAALSRVAGLETSFQCEFLVRRLHGNLSGENQPPSSSVAESQKRCGSAAILERTASFPLLRSGRQSAVYLSMGRQSRTTIAT